MKAEVCGLEARGSSLFCHTPEVREGGQGRDVVAKSDGAVSDRLRTKGYEAPAI